MCLYNPFEPEMNFTGLLHSPSTIQKKIGDGNTQNNNNIIPKTWELQGHLVYLI